jgi:hypothetical protein
VDAAGTLPSDAAAKQATGLALTSMACTRAFPCSSTRMRPSAVTASAVGEPKRPGRMPSPPTSVDGCASASGTPAAGMATISSMFIDACAPTT